MKCRYTLSSSADQFIVGRLKSPTIKTGLLASVSSVIQLHMAIDNHCNKYAIYWLSPVFSDIRFPNCLTKVISKSPVSPQQSKQSRSYALCRHIWWFSERLRVKLLLQRQEKSDPSGKLAECQKWWHPKSGIDLETKELKPLHPVVFPLFE